MPPAGKQRSHAICATTSPTHATTTTGSHQNPDSIPSPTDVGAEDLPPHDEYASEAPSLFREPTARIAIDSETLAYQIIDPRRDEEIVVEAAIELVPFQSAGTSALDEIDDHHDRAFDLDRRISQHIGRGNGEPERDGLCPRAGIVGKKSREAQFGMAAEPQSRRSADDGSGQQQDQDLSGRLRPPDLPYDPMNQESEHEQGRSEQRDGHGSALRRPQIGEPGRGRLGDRIRVPQGRVAPIVDIRQYFRHTVREADLRFPTEI